MRQGHRAIVLRAGCGCPRIPGRHSIEEFRIQVLPRWRSDELLPDVVAVKDVAPEVVAENPVLACVGGATDRYIHGIEVGVCPPASGSVIQCAWLAVRSRQAVD